MSEIDRKADEVIAFWFDEVGPQGWYAKDAALDARIARRFGALRDAVLASGAAGWRDTPRALLAAIILLDQFSRNLFRGKAEAFAADPLARELTRLAIANGWDASMPIEQRRFVYMPLMHGEDMASQDESVARFDALAEDGHDKFAHLHRDQIVRFGRFPGRNAALGRVSTDAERAALDTGAAF